MCRLRLIDNETCADNIYYVALSMKYAARQRNTSTLNVHRQCRVAASLPELEWTLCSLGRGDALFDGVESYVCPTTFCPNRMRIASLLADRRTARHVGASTGTHQRRPAVDARVDRGRGSAYRGPMSGRYRPAFEQPSDPHDAVAPSNLGFALCDPREFSAFGGQIIPVFLVHLGIGSLPRQVSQRKAVA